jgi:hypothetical protein
VHSASEGFDSVPAIAALSLLVRCRTTRDKEFLKILKRWVLKTREIIVWQESNAERRSVDQWSRGSKACQRRLSALSISSCKIGRLVVGLFHQFQWPFCSTASKVAP